MPSVSTGVSELRVRGEDGIYRAFYYTALAEGILLFRALIKKTQRTPPGEIHLARKRLKEPLRKSAAREVVRNYSAWVESSITPATVIRASEIGENWQLSFWDGMILAAAEQDQAAELLTEDLTHGQVIAGIKIVNPFIQPTAGAR
jgi:hypothetical protein